MRAPLLVYLDSSDISRFANAKRGPDEEAVLQQLLSLVGGGLVRCVFSMAHIAELAPLSSKYVPHAAARAEVLVNLCGRNVVASVPTVLELELAALSGATVQASVVRDDGMWFPDVGMLIDESHRVDIRAEIATASKAQGLNREQRRKLEQKAMRHGRFRPEVQAFVDGATQESLKDFGAMVLPIPDSSYQPLKRYVFGSGSRQAANDGFLEIFRDPRRLIQWFVTKPEMMAPVSSWLRESAKRLNGNAEDLARTAAEARALFSMLGIDQEKAKLDRGHWMARQNKLMVHFFHGLLEDSGRIPSTGLSVQMICDSCPGLSTTFQMGMSVLGDVTNARPRKPLESDFGDALHAMYAPYVDIFRADSFAAGHLKRYVNPETVVVPSLKQLLPAIHECLAARPSPHQSSHNAKK